MADLDLLYAVASVESKGNPNARGSSGEYGLMQLMPANVEKFGVKDPLDWKQNLQAGDKLLDEEIGRFGDTRLALAAYNAGSPAVNRAIKQAGTTDYDEVAKYLPASTRDHYVPSVMNAYSSRKGERVENAKATYATDTNDPDAPWGTKDEFKDEVGKLLTSPTLTSLSPTETVQALSRIYDSKKWEPQVDGVMQELTDSVWSTVPMDERPNIAEAAAPYLARVNGEDEESVRKSAQANQREFEETLKKSGVSPYAFGREIDKIFQYQASEQTSRAGARNRGILGTIGAAGKEILRGAAEGYTSAAAAIPDLAGYEETGKAVRDFPKNTLGEIREFDYETNEDGSIKLDERGEPITRYRGQILRGVGQVASFLLGGALLKGVGFGAKGITLALGGVNGLMGMDQGYSMAREEGADREGAMMAAMASIPGSAAMTAADVVTLGTGRIWTQGLTGANKVRAMAQGAIESALIAGGGSAAQQAGILAGVQSATGKEVLTAENVGSAFIAGAAVGGVLGAVHGSNYRPETTAKTTQTADSATSATPTPREISGYVDDTRNIAGYIEDKRGTTGLPDPRKPVAGYLSKPGERPQLDTPENYRSGRPIEMPQAPRPEEQIALTQKLEEFQRHPSKALIVEGTDANAISQDILDFFKLQAERVSDNEVRLSKQESYPTRTYEALDEVEAAIDENSKFLANAPDPKDYAALVEKRAQLKKQLYDVDGFNKDIDTKASTMAREKARIESAIKERETQMKRFRDPVLKKVLRMEIDDLQQQLSPMKEFAQSQQGRALKIREQINDVNARLLKLQDPLYMNNLSARQRTLRDALRKRADILDTQIPKEEEVANSALKERFKNAAIQVKTPEGPRYILGMNDKWFVLDEKGSPLSSGDVFFPDAVRRSLEKAPTQPTPAPVGPGTSPKGKPAQFKLQYGKALEIGAAARMELPKKIEEIKSNVRQAAKGTRDLDKTAVPKAPKPASKKKTAAKKATRAKTPDGENITSETPEASAESTISAAAKEKVAKPDPEENRILGELSQDDEMVAASTSGGRDVDPIVNDGKSIKSPRSIQQRFEELFNKKISYGPIRSRKRGSITLGQANASTGNIRVRFHGDLRTTAHEFAHKYDMETGLSDFNRATQENIESGETNFAKEFSELEKLAPGGSGGADQSPQYNAREGVAEYIHTWMVNPNKAITEYPEFTKTFDRLVPEEKKAIFRELGDEIRKRAGAPALDRILSTIQTKPESKSFLDKAADFFRSPHPDRFEPTGWEKYITKYFGDDASAYMKAIDTVVKRDPTKMTDAELAKAFYRGFVGGETGKVEEFFRHGIRNAYDYEKFESKPWKAVFDPLRDSPAEEQKADLDLVRAYLKADRTSELLRQRAQGKRDGIGPVGGIADGPNMAAKGETEEVVAKQFFEDFTKVPQERQRRVLQVVQNYRDFADAALRYMRDKGRISSEFYDELKANNQHYAAMLRVMDENDQVFGSGKSLSKDQSPLKKAKGSGRQSRDPFEALLEVTNKMIREADRNEMLRSFTDLMKSDKTSFYGKEPVFGDIAEELSAQDAYGKTDVVKVYTNGKESYWKINPYVKDVLDGYSAVDSSIMRVISLPTRTLKAGVSLSPPFVNRNTIRDSFDRMILSDLSAKTQVRETLRSLKSFGRAGAMEADAALLRAYNGDQGGFNFRKEVDYHRFMRAALDELSGDKNTILYAPIKAFDWYKGVVETSEALGRTAEFRGQYKKYLSEGRTPYEAGVLAGAKARGLMDFVVAGRFMRYIEQLAPYSNASVQGFRKFVGTAKTNPKAFAAKTLLYGVIPMLLVRQYNISVGADREYNQLADYRKDMFYNLKIPGTTKWVSIPKAFSAALASSFADRAVSKARGEQNAFHGINGVISNALVPVDVTAFAIQGVKPIHEVWANKDSFRDKNIVPPYEENLNLENRAESRGTSRFADAVQALAEHAGLGNTAFGKRFMNSRAVDFMTRAYFGNLGAMFLQATDIGRSKGGNPLTVAKASGLTSETPVYAAKGVQEVLDYAAGEGISTQNRKLKVLANAIESYFQADPDKKMDAANKVYDIADKIKAGYSERGAAYFGQRKKTPSPQ